jgi:hypothetical protein
MLNPEIEPPAVIHTVPHEPWQQPSLRLPKAMEEKATEIVKEKVKMGLLGYSQGPYRSQFFLVEKKNPGEYRLINDVQPRNGVTIRDSGMPSGNRRVFRGLWGMSHPLIYRLLFQLQSDPPRSSFSRPYCISDTFRIITADATSTGMDEFSCLLHVDHHQSLVVSYSALCSAFHR